MRKTIIAVIMAAAALPSIAAAQTRELHNDRVDLRQERRDLDRAYRSGDRDEIRDQRDDYRDARREYRDDRRDYVRDNWGHDDWRRYREQHRDLYRGGGWHSDHRYQSFRPGVRVNIGYYQPRFYMNDYARYRLPRPGWNQRWVRHYNDVLLIDVRSGYVIDVYRNFFW
jgi:Ni/Co efflux regulator RcnB